MTFKLLRYPKNLNGLRLAYPLENRMVYGGGSGLTTFDYSGFGQTGTLALGGQSAGQRGGFGIPITGPTPTAMHFGDSSGVSSITTTFPSAINFANPLTVVVTMQMSSTPGTFPEVFSIYNSGAASIVGNGLNGAVMSPLYVNGRTGTGTVTLVAGLWYRYVGTWDGTNVRDYLNGVDFTGSQTGTFVAGSHNVFTIAKGQDGNTPWRGSMRDFRYYTRAWSRAEAVDDWREQVSASKMGYWPGIDALGWVPSPAPSGLILMGQIML